MRTRVDSEEREKILVKWMALRFAIIPAALFCGLFFWGCRNRDQVEKDVCEQIVYRRIACLKAAAEQDPSIEAELAVENATINRGRWTDRCRKEVDGKSRLKKGLGVCLSYPDCQRLMSCYEDLFVVERAERMLAMIEEGRNGAIKDLASVCEDEYLFGRLRASGDESAEQIARRLKERCSGFRERVVEKSEDILNAMVQRGDADGLERICLTIAAEREKKVHAGTRKRESGWETEERIRAIEKLCRERWRFRSVHNRIGRIRRLMDQGAIEKVLDACRAQEGFTRELFRTGQRAAAALGEHFERVCRRDAHLYWLKVRLVDWKDKAGPLTCKRARQLYSDTASRYPDDPMVHITEVWLEEVCARF